MREDENRRKAKRRRRPAAGRPGTDGRAGQLRTAGGTGSSRSAGGAGRPGTDGGAGQPRTAGGTGRPRTAGSISQPRAASGVRPSIKTIDGKPVKRQNIVRLTRKKKERPPRRFINNNRRKLMISFGVILLLMVALVVQLTYINATSGDKYRKQVLSQLNYNSTTIPYRRGDITDRNGTILATSEKVYNLILDPYVMTNSKVKDVGDCVDTTLDVLEKYFGMDRSEVKALVESDKDNRYRVLKKQLTYEELQPYYTLMNSEEKADTAISKYVKGIWFEDDYIRRYPYNTLACDLLGFTVSGNVGTYGIEQYYTDVLNGTDGREYGYLTEDTSLERTTISPVNGNNITSTIDINIQRIVEKHIWEFNEAIGSKNTAVIVMDPNNGEILAMASYPVFDLNNPRDLTGYYTKEQIKEMTSEEKMEIYNSLWRNFCISDPFEPGSTAKVMTVAAGLDEGVITPSTEFTCDGGEDFQDGNGVTRILCNNTTGHGTMDLAGALMVSCNDALMDIGARLGKTSFTKYQEMFNLGQVTNVDLPGEASAEGLIYYENNMGPVELATNAFGQGYVATALQMTASFASIVNGGYYYKPHVVKQISTESGSTVEVVDKELVRTTVSAETSEWVRGALLRTVNEGTAKKAYIEGYTIGAKTGTAEKKPITDKKNTVSLISCAPAEAPQVVVYVVIDEPQLDNQAESGLASIMSRKIYEEMLPYLQIFPSTDDGEISGGESDAQQTDEFGNPVETDEFGNPVETDEFGNPVDSQETDEFGNPVDSDSTNQPETDADGNPVEGGTSDTGESDESDGSGTDGDGSDVGSTGSGTSTVWKHLTDTQKANLVNEYLAGTNKQLKKWDE